MEAHHEIYLSDPRKTVSEKLKTILRQPLEDLDRQLRARRRIGARAHDGLPLVECRYSRVAIFARRASTPGCGCGDETYSSHRSGCCLCNCRTRRLEARLRAVTASGGRSVASGGSIGSTPTSDRTCVAPVPTMPTLGRRLRAGLAQRPTMGLTRAVAYTDGGRMSGNSADASGERAVAAGGDIGSVSTGDFVTQVARATILPSEALHFSGRVFHLPQRAAQFVGRERELRLLDDAFVSTGGVVVHAVHGLGGIGKSTLAAHWAASRAAVYNPVWWITAESPSELQAGLAALGRALQPALIGVLTDEALRERALQWLSSHDGWLLVLDNVSDPSHIESLVARAPGGRFLITTRLGAATWRAGTATLDLDVLELSEAVQLFQRIYDGPADGVEDLCAEVGCLPLALDQAAAYCREAAVTPGRYLDLLALHPAQMLAATAELGDAQRTVARV